MIDWVCYFMARVEDWVNEAKKCIYEKHKFFINNIGSYAV